MADRNKYSKKTRKTKFEQITKTRVLKELSQVIARPSFQIFGFTNWNGMIGEK